MCYSSQVWADFRKYLRTFPAARMSIGEFARLLRLRVDGQRIVLPKGMTDPFKQITPQNQLEEECRDLVLAYEASQRTALEQELFKQRRRVVDAERALAIKATKKASEDLRIGSAKVSDILDKLADLERTEHLDRDDRIYPGSYCPVMTLDEPGELVIVPMRYQCRPAGMPAMYDKRFPGLYNARRDSLTAFWKGQFRQTHAVVVAEHFFEHVARHKMEGRDLADGEQEQDVILKFTPAGGHPMLLASLWSRWHGKDEDDLLSFAVITDEPPAEVSASGHDRCPIPLKESNVKAWLSAGLSPSEYQAILDDRERPHYDYRLAA